MSSLVEYVERKLEMKIFFLILCQTTWIYSMCHVITSLFKSVWHCRGYYFKNIRRWLQSPFLCFLLNISNKKHSFRNLINSLLQRISELNSCLKKKISISVKNIQILSVFFFTHKLQIFTHKLHLLSNIILECLASISEAYNEWIQNNNGIMWFYFQTKWHSSFSIKLCDICLLYMHIQYCMIENRPTTSYHVKNIQRRINKLIRKHKTYKIKWSLLALIYLQHKSFIYHAKM